MGRPLRSVTVDEPDPNEALQRHIDHLNEDIGRLRAELNPPKSNLNPVVDTIVQMGLAIGRISQPLRRGPVRTPEEEARHQKALLIPGLLMMGLFGGGLLGGLVWHLENGGGLPWTLLTGVAISAIAGMLLVPFCLAVSAFARAALGARNRGRPDRQVPE